MKSLVLFALISLALIAVCAWLLGFAFSAPGDHAAIRVSAVTAYVLQLGTFAIARSMAATNAMAGWGIGTLLRFAAVALFALVLIEPLGLARVAALMSLATFLFVSTLVEPWLLSR